MKSNKQRKQEIKAKRKVKAEKDANMKMPKHFNVSQNLVLADQSKLVGRGYYCLPAFYLDKKFTCRDCGVKEVWTAQQQKWWYEVAKGDINSTAVRCKSCRDKINAEKVAQKAHMAEMAKIQPHPNVAFFKMRF